METVLLPHFQDHPLYIALFKDVQNAPFLRKQLLEGNTDFEYAFLDASMVSDTIANLPMAHLRLADPVSYASSSSMFSSGQRHVKQSTKESQCTF